jgi:hypothetical protein
MVEDKITNMEYKIITSPQPWWVSMTSATEKDIFSNQACLI